MKTTKMFRMIGDELDRVTAAMRQATAAWDQAKDELGTNTDEWHRYANAHRNELAQMAGATLAIAQVVRLLAAGEVNRPATRKPRKIASSTRAKSKRK